MNVQVERIAEIAARRLEAADGKLDGLTTYDFAKAVAQIKADVEVAKELIALIAGSGPKLQVPTYRTALDTSQLFPLKQRASDVQPPPAPDAGA